MRCATPSWEPPGATTCSRSSPPPATSSSPGSTTVVPGTATTTSGASSCSRSSAPPSPRRSPSCALRAAYWLDDHGLVDDAIRQFVAAGDRQQAAALVIREIGACVLAGRAATLRRWLGWFEVEEVRTSPGLTLLAVWVASLRRRCRGRPALDGMRRRLPSRRDAARRDGARCGPRGRRGPDGSRRNDGIDPGGRPDHRARTGRQSLVGLGPPDRRALARQANGEIEDPDCGISCRRTRRRGRPGVLGVATAHRADPGRTRASNHRRRRRCPRTRWRS